MESCGAQGRSAGEALPFSSQCADHRRLAGHTHFRIERPSKQVSTADCCWETGFSKSSCDRGGRASTAAAPKVWPPRPHPCRNDKPNKSFPVRRPRMTPECFVAQRRPWCACVPVRIISFKLILLNCSSFSAANPRLDDQVLRPALRRYNRRNSRSGRFLHYVAVGVGARRKHEHVHVGVDLGQKLAAQHAGEDAMSQVALEPRALVPSPTTRSKSSSDQLLAAPVRGPPEIAPVFPG